MRLEALGKQFWRLFLTLTVRNTACILLFLWLVARRKRLHLTANFISNIIIVLLCKRELPELKIIPYKKLKMQYKLIANYSVFVVINNVGQKIIFYTDALVIGIFLSPSAVTYYAIPGNLIEYKRKIVMALTGVLNPLTSQLEAMDEKDKINSVLLKGTKFSLLVGFPISVVILIMGKRFISLWMGNEYSVACGGVLMVLAVTHLLSLTHYTIDNILYGLSKHNIIAYLRIVEAIANITISLLLVRSLGIIGVAIGTAIPHIIIMAIVLPIVVCKILGLGIINYIKSSIVPSAISIIPFSASCYYVNKIFPADFLGLFFLEIFLLCPIYILTCWYVSFSKDERVEYKKIIQPFIPFMGRT